MKISEVKIYAGCNNTLSYSSGIAKAAVISAMMAGTPAQAQDVKYDTYEITPKTEYVNEMNNVYDDVFVYSPTDTVKSKKARGDEFNSWVVALLKAADDSAQVDSLKMDGKSVNFMLNEDESIKQLAECIIASFDKNGDKKVDIEEYLEKVFNSKELGVSDENVPIRFFNKYPADPFSGFDINDGYYKKFKINNKYNTKEVAATLKALSEVDSSGNKPRTYINGQNLLDEIYYTLYYGEVNPDFRDTQKKFYKRIIK